MRELDKISEELFDKIRARFDHVSIGDEKAERITDPSQARFFNFDYVDVEGRNYGNVTISLIDENSLKVYYSSNIVNGLDEEQEDSWYSFLKSLKKFARRNLLMFDTRDITRSNLDLKDLKQQGKSDGTYDKDELSAVTESKLYGTSRSSYADVGPHKLIIRHSDHIDPERRGSRARKIEHIFVETPLGERFLLNHTNLHGARATANHLRHGGRFGDEGSELINEMVKEMASMKHFVRSMRNRTFEDQETTGMVEAAIHRYNEVKHHLKRFQGRQGHELLMSMTEQSPLVDDEFDVDSLRERFVKKIYDDRFNEALPYVYRAYKNRQESAPSGSKEFESWANDITEETWDSDNDDHDEQELTDLIQHPIAVGVDGTDAVLAIKHVHFLNTDDLHRALEKLARSQGPDADARRVIAGWLASNGENVLANEIIQVLQTQNQATQPQPTSPAVPKQPVGATTMDEPVVSEDIELIKFLSGLAKK